MFTDHRALVYLYCMQDVSNVVTRWAIALQDFGFTIRHVVPGKLRTLWHLVSSVCRGKRKLNLAWPSIGIHLFAATEHTAAPVHTWFRHRLLVARTVANPSQIILSRLQVPSTYFLVWTLMPLSSCKMTNLGDYLDVVSWSTDSSVCPSDVAVGCVLWSDDHLAFKATLDRLSDR